MSVLVLLEKENYFQIGRKNWVSFNVQNTEVVAGTRYHATELRKA